MTQNICVIGKYKSKEALDKSRNLINENKYNQALKFAQIAYKYFSKSKDVIYTYAECLYLCGYDKKASKLFEQIENYNDPFYQGMTSKYYLACCYCAIKSNLFKALKLINQSIKLNQKYDNDIKQDLEIKGQILYNLGSYDSALSIFKRLYRENYSISHISVYLSKIYFKKGNYLKGYKYFKKVLKDYDNIAVDFSYVEIQSYFVILHNRFTKDSKIKLNQKLRNAVQKKLGMYRLKDADLLIYSNNLSVALKYDKSIKSAPFVVYKSNNISVAFNKTEQFNIPKYESLIANSIYRNTLIQDVIEHKFYDSVAELFAITYKNKTSVS